MGIVAALGNTVPNIVLATAIVNFPLYVRDRPRRDQPRGARPASWTPPAWPGIGTWAVLLLPGGAEHPADHDGADVAHHGLRDPQRRRAVSFIGLGVRPPMPEWGIMVAEGASFIVSGEWWVALFPGATLMVAVFCFNLLGDGIRDIVDPRRRT